jgi:hypothetical protein
MAPCLLVYRQPMTNLCPRCDEQGTVATYLVRQTGEHVRVCDECDALWPDGVQVAPNTFLDLTDYLGQRGRPGLWTELTPVDS